MVNFGKFIAKHSKLIILICVLLLIPSGYGYFKTRINYDILTYLPDSLETVKGQDILVDEFGMGAFSMVVVEDMELKDVHKLKQEIEKVDHVKEVIWYDSLVDITVPVEMLPSDIKDALFNGNATMMVALFDDTTSADNTMNAISELRSLVKGQCFFSGMSGIVTDVKKLCLQEMPIYVTIAAVLSLLVLLLTLDSFVTPFLFLFSIGAAILYNLGSNIFLGEISYITQALTAVLQLGVTMDYSIFLLSSYEANKKRYNNDKQRAMAHAISNTFSSVVGSSITTIAGFIALCFMTFTLGRDIGVVMAKGVVIGVICCITFLPALILVFDNAIEKTHHKSLVPNMDGVSDFITKHYKISILLFVVIMIPAIYGNNHYGVYYDIAGTLPKELESMKANAKLEEHFDMNGVYMVMLENGHSAKDKEAMLNKIKEVDGVKWALGLNSVVGANIPEDMIPSEYRSKLQSDDYEIQFICSDYKTGTDEMNEQVAEVTKIIKSFGESSMVIGEGPLTKDLIDTTDIDLQNVNVASIGAIFVIILLVLKSLSLPFILVLVIEFAIFVNMAIPYYTGVTLPFVASIVIGTIQLGSTVDYAILMTTRYKKERMSGLSKQESIQIAHRTSIKSILLSGCILFAATFGVGMYSNIDMISSICTLLSRGAFISTIVVILVLPAMFMVFDKLIIHTTLGFRKNKAAQNASVNEM